MPHHQLAGVVEKLRNADEHLHRLNDATLRYLNATPNAAIISNRDRAKGRVRSTSRC
jgi:hypothetical protein